MRPASPREDPEEWCPPPRPRPTLLRPDDEARLTRIREAGRPDRFDVAWLCATVERLSRTTHDQFEFPPFCALVNFVASNAVQLRFVAVEDHRSPPLEFFENAVVFDIERPRISNVEALLVVRPYIRLVEEPSEPVLEEIFASKMSVRIADETVCEAPVHEILMRPDGTGFRRAPFSFPRPPSDTLTHGAARMGYNDDVLENELIGRFLPIDTPIEVSVALRRVARLPEPVKIVAGIVAARYTTKPGCR